MTTLTIRDIDEELEHKLRLRAANRDRSIEDEAREILRSALSNAPAVGEHLVDRIRRIVEPLGGFELELPPRGPIREPPDFT